MYTIRLASFRILPVLVGLTLASVARAQSDDPDLTAAFRQTYERYGAAFAASDFEAAAAAAEEALALGLELFGENHPNTAGLRQNQALMLELQGRADEAEAEYLKALDILEALGQADSLAAVPVLLQLGGMYFPVGGAQVRYLQRALEIQRAAAPDDLPAYAELAVEAAGILSRDPQGRQFAREILLPVLAELEDAYGDDSFHLVPVLLALGRATPGFVDEDLRVEWSERALEIAEDAFPDDPAVPASVALEAGRDLMSTSQPSNSEAFLEDAVNYFEESVGHDDERFAESAMLLGLVRVRMGRSSRAEPVLVDALEFFAGKAAFHAHESRIRRTLVEILVRGNRFDEATPHFVALARLTAGAEMQEYQPVYQVAPVYPPGAARQGLSGYVVLRYTVTATGETANIVVVESSNPLFETAAIRAAESFRYIPRMVDGELVDTDGVTNRIGFDLER